MSQPKSAIKTIKPTIRISGSDSRQIPTITISDPDKKFGFSKDTLDNGNNPTLASTTSGKTSGAAAMAIEIEIEKNFPELREEHKTANDLNGNKEKRTTHDLSKKELREIEELNMKGANIDTTGLEKKIKAHEAKLEQQPKFNFADKFGPKEKKPGTQISLLERRKAAAAAAKNENIPPIQNMNKMK